MTRSTLRGRWLLAASPLALGLVAPLTAHAQIGTTAPPVETITVTAQRLNAARASIETQTGASTYTIDSTALEATPGGSNAPLNEIILQAQGVAQDSFGQLHVRGDHNGLQYRLNGIILPEGLSGFGQILSPRLISSLKMITGVLPAEYGLRTAAIIDLTTKSGSLQPGGTVAIYGGSHNTIEPSFNYGGTAGNVTYFLSGDYVANDLGIESPDGRSTPLHDHTAQYHGFGYLEDVLNENNRISFIFGTSRGEFQIPDQAGQQPALGLVVNGQRTYPNDQLNENQREITHFGIVSFQHAGDRFDLNTSFITRYSSLFFSPDPLGDLLYNGIAETAYKRDVSLALQTDGAYRVTEAHTIRAGLYVQRDRALSQTGALVLPTDALGNQLTDLPASVIDNGTKTQWIESLYLQDEWKAFDRVIVNYGLRLDHLSAYITATQLSPRVNLLWDATDTTKVHAGYARYFTPPPFELVGSETITKFVNTTAAPAVLTNDPVKAESANYFDIGVEQKVGTALTLGADAFYRLSHNLIDEGQFGAPIIQTPFNYEKGRIYGLELSSNYVAGPFTAYANLSLEQARGFHIVSSEFNFDPTELAYIANHAIDLDHAQHLSASAGASYLWSGTRISADMLLGSGLRAERDLPNGVIVPNGAHLPYYAVVNLGVQHTFNLGGTTQLQARLDVINLGDHVYQIRNGTGVGVGAPQFGARRGVFGGVAVVF